MNNTIEALPYPFDPARPLRDANRARIDLIYQAALNQAERIAQSTDQPSTWPLNPDVMRVTVQPIAPSARLLAPKEIAEQERALQDGPVGKFFSDSARPIPTGVMWSDFYIDGGDRNARIALENGTVCHIGQALSKSKDDLPRLYLSELMTQIILCVQVAHQLHKEHVPETGMALSVEIRNLGQYAAINHQGVTVCGKRIALLENWVWQYHIPAPIFAAEAEVNKQILTVVEEVYWGFGYFNISRQLILNLAMQQGLVLAS